MTGARGSASEVVRRPIVAEHVEQQLLADRRGRRVVGAARQRCWVWRLANPPLITEVPVGDFIRFR